MNTDLAAERRIAALQRARTSQAARKRQDVLDTLQTMTGNGVRVTFDLVARRAGVSRQFLYSDPELRTAVEQARSRPPSNPSRDVTGDADGLLTDLLLAREEIKRLRSETARRELTARNAELVRESSSLRRQLATAHEDLAAARDTNRDLMTELNRRPSRRE
jgi:hypothetical protein